MEIVVVIMIVEDGKEADPLSNIMLKVTLTTLLSQNGYEDNLLKSTGV